MCLWGPLSLLMLLFATLLGFAGGLVAAPRLLPAPDAYVTRKYY
jgi:hypothetical protein